MATLRGNSVVSGTPHRFVEEARKAKVVPDLTDRIGSARFLAARTNCRKEAQIQFEEASLKRLGSLNEQHEAAHIYLALGFCLLETPTIRVTNDGEVVNCSKMFHFAGHAFREIGQLNRAADAYWRAGVTDSKLTDFTVRSLSRSKSCYEGIGETELSDQMHQLEWEARRIRSATWRRIGLLIWLVTTNYGTSLRRWLGSVMAVLLAYSIGYEILHCLGHVGGSAAWTTGLSGVYFFLVTTATVGYGDISPIDWVGQLTVATNIVLGYVLLGLGTTILGRKALGR